MADIIDTLNINKEVEEKTIIDNEVDKVKEEMVEDFGPQTLSNGDTTAPLPKSEFSFDAEEAAKNDNPYADQSMFGTTRQHKELATTVEDLKKPSTVNIEGFFKSSTVVANSLC